MLSFFTRKRDALGKLGILPPQRIIAAFRLMTYRTAADSMDELPRVSETSMSNSLILICETIFSEFGSEYRRGSKEDDLKRIEAINEFRWFPGFLESIECKY